MNKMSMTIVFAVILIVQTANPLPQGFFRSSDSGSADNSKVTPTSPAIDTSSSKITEGGSGTDSVSDTKTVNANADGLSKGFPLSTWGQPSGLFPLYSSPNFYQYPLFPTYYPLFPRSHLFPLFPPHLPLSSFYPRYYPWPQLYPNQFIPY